MNNSCVLTDGASDWLICWLGLYHTSSAK